MERLESYDILCEYYSEEKLKKNSKQIGNILNNYFKEEVRIQNLSYNDKLMWKYE